MSDQAGDSAASQTVSIGDYSLPSLLGLGLLIVATAVVWYQPELGDALRYERGGFNAELLPSLLAAAGHLLVHINAQHAMLNIVALLCIYVLFSEAFSSLWWLAALLASAIASAYGLYFYSPATDWCVGMSGALHGLFVYAVLRDRAHWLWLLAIAAKLTIEQQQWALLEPLANASERVIGYDVVVDAHLWGAAGGLLFYAMVRSIAMLMVLREIASAPDRKK